ncbi:4'-phosphopantetheinyl transferase family protein, partial [Enterococcus faecium]|uniref:4'-phosphopantetheinyl transferase family protein n=1 Tax=Enterococcus faecium TaxID=1352 RepID=UPI003F444CA5
APDERARADRFVYAADREHYTIGRALLRTILSSYLRTPPEAIELANGPQGKPALAASQSPLHFNLTHSGAYAALAVCC